MNISRQSWWHVDKWTILQSLLELNDKSCLSPFNFSFNSFPVHSLHSSSLLNKIYATRVDYFIWPDFKSFKGNLPQVQGISDQLFLEWFTIHKSLKRTWNGLNRCCGSYSIHYTNYLANSKKDYVWLLLGSKRRAMAYTMIIIFLCS